MEQKSIIGVAALIVVVIAIAAIALTFGGESGNDDGGDDGEIPSDIQAHIDDLVADRQYVADNMVPQIVDAFVRKDGVLTDAMPLPACTLPCEPLIKGDMKSVSIAAASILAKVTRDRIMKGYDAQYPQYGFARHKGYPTKAHLQALETYGVLPIHRRSYAPVREALMPHLDLCFDAHDQH